MEKEITYKKPLFRRQIGVSYKPIVIAKSLESRSISHKPIMHKEQHKCIGNR